MSNVVHGDCLESMRAMPENSVTAIVTDPPYGLEFMGKGWDRVLPPTEVWREALRVLRPGGHALIFGGTRTYHRLACAVEDAGFEVRDCLMWLYGQGFPKSLDVSKAIDKAAGAERAVIGTKAGPGYSASAPQGKSTWSGGFGGDGDPMRECAITAPATDAARLWSGYGTALKPAWEPILLARKPLVGTVERNCRKHGTGALNIDGCRIESGADYHDLDVTQGGDNHFSVGSDAKTRGTKFQPADGRWPANLILDEAAAAQLDAQAPDKGQAAPLKETGRARPGHGRLGEMGPPVACEPHDAPGGASRFFYCSKASKRDRGEGNNHPTVKPVELMRWLVRLVKGPQDNLILDPFAGSGTTGVACQLEGVPFLLLEREAEYVEIIRRRLQEQPS